MIREYTREAGVRELERQIGTVCRKVATRVAEGATQSVTITEVSVPDYLGKPSYFHEVAERTQIPGVATGLAWTPAGGDILFIEATQMRGSKGFTLTGQLGDVMRESAQAALSYVRSKAKDLGIDEEVFEKSDIHLHVPAGAIPKDGPSAGVTMATALASLLQGCARVSRIGDDWRDHLARPGSAGRRHQGKDPGRPSRRAQEGLPAPAQRKRFRRITRTSAQ